MDSTSSATVSAHPGGSPSAVGGGVMSTGSASSGSAGQAAAASSVDPPRAEDPSEQSDAHASPDFNHYAFVKTHGDEKHAELCRGASALVKGVRAKLVGEGAVASLSERDVTEMLEYKLLVRDAEFDVPHFTELSRTQQDVIGSVFQVQLELQMWLRGIVFDKERRAMIKSDQ